MKSYKVTITETLEKEVVVKAKIAEDALSKVRQDYRDAADVLAADTPALLWIYYSVNVIMNGERPMPTGRTRHINRLRREAALS